MKTFKQPRYIRAIRKSIEYAEAHLYDIYKEEKEVEKLIKSLHRLANKTPYESTTK